MLKVKVLRSCNFFAPGEEVRLFQLHVYFTQKAIDSFEEYGYIELVNKQQYTNMKTAVEQIARTCHEVNRAYCISIGDHSQPTWDGAPDWQKNSAINGVNYHLANPDSKPEDSHNNWMAEKQRDGWKYGPEKNPETKEHPCFVPYDELPKEQQVKDLLFIAVVRSFE